MDVATYIFGKNRLSKIKKVAAMRVLATLGKRYRGLRWWFDKHMNNSDLAMKNLKLSQDGLARPSR